MAKGNQVCLWLCIGLCLVSGGVWGDPYVEDFKLEDQWEEQFWSFLESSEHAQLRIAAAINLNQKSDKKETKRSEQLVASVLDISSPDPEVLWLLAFDCQWRESASWCEPGGVYEMLLDADPKNAAVLMLRFSQSRLGGDESLLDTEANRQLLLKAAEATHFDDYSLRNVDKLYLETLNFVSLNAMPPIPRSEPGLQDVMQPYVDAASWAMAVIVAAPSFGYSNVIDLCRAQARKQHSEGVAACRKLALVLRESSNSVLAASIGFAIDRTMLEEIDPDDPGVKHWQLRKDIFQLVYMCQLVPWITDDRLLLETSETSIMNWAKNLSELGEWEGNRKTSFQEYAVSTDNFIVNPGDCNKLNDLDDEAIEELFKDRNPVLAWKSILSEARGDSGS